MQDEPLTPDPWCRKLCDGAPQVHAFGGMLTHTAHVHHRCWNCDREVLSSYLETYKCLDCGVEQGACQPAPASSDYDEDFAAERCSPA